MCSFSPSKLKAIFFSMPQLTDAPASLIFHKSALTMSTFLMKSSKLGFLHPLQHFKVKSAKALSEYVSMGWI